MPRVSVIIPAYKGERFIAQAVKSVQNQSLRDWELIVVDDGSPDASGDVALRQAGDDPRVRVVRKENGGVATARNRGFAESDPASPYLLFLDQDDQLARDALAFLSRALDSNPYAIAAHGRLISLDDAGHVHPTAECLYLAERWGMGRRQPVKWPASRPTTLNVLMLVNVMRTPGLALIRRRAFERIGLFEQSLAPADDLDMVLRLATVGPIAYVDRVALRYRIHDSNVTSLQEDATNSATVRAYQKLLDSPTLTTKQTKEARRAYRWQGQQLHRYVHYKHLLWARESACNGHWLQAATQMRHAITGSLRARLSSRPPA